MRGGLLAALLSLLVHGTSPALAPILLVNQNLAPPPAVQDDDIGLEQGPAVAAAPAASQAVVAPGGYEAFAAGEAAAARGDDAGARMDYETAIEQGLSALWQVAALRGLADSYLAADQPEVAVARLERAAAIAATVEAQKAPVWYDGELVQRGSDARVPAVLLPLARAQAEAGAPSEAAATYARLIADYPAAAEARAALDALAGLGAANAIDAYQRGLVLYQADRLREAIAAFSAFLASGPGPTRAAAARYYAARSQAELGDRAGAAAQLIAMAGDYPGGAQAPDALLRAGRLTEGGSRAADAVGIYTSVADAYPASPAAAQALLAAARLLLRRGDAAGARATWERLAGHPTAEARAQGFFWLGRSLLDEGDAAAARTALEAATDAAPWSYEGLRAQDLLDYGPGTEPYRPVWTEQVGGPSPDEAEACAAWIDTWADPAAATGAADVLARIDRLLQVGMRGPALGEALDALAAPAADPHDLDHLARGLERRGLYALTIYAANRLAAVSPAGVLDRAPACAQRLAYPLAFGDVVQREGQTYGLDPYVLLGLLRQESWFNSHALSSAQARGMAQVIPSTARDIARGLGIQNFSDDDLYRPEESIAFCAWYLDQQYRDLQRRPLLALAAYNAGPGNARRWTGGNLRLDPDDYVEAIDFTETRGYVRAIYQHYRHYRALYG